MDKEVLENLGLKIGERFGSNLNVTEEIRLFLDNNLSLDSKKRALKDIYLCSLYSNAYLGPDPRSKSTLLMSVYAVLKSNDDQELNQNLDRLNKATDILKEAEVNPIEAITNELENNHNQKDVKY